MQTGRRGFFQAAIYGLWGLITANLTLPAAAYLFFPPHSRREGEWIEAGDIKDLKPGTPEEMVFRRNRVDGWKVVSEKTTAWVLKKSDTEVIAFAPQCTHLGCAYHWNDRTHEFLCPCHTSTFSPEGQVLTGPAPRALDRYETRLQGGKLLLGKIRTA
ncbi:MAG TPA: Rieske (2Fe-2S) protein [Solibacterales bacterium]|nr:Rieske (2Fe-2S) protein [Bryobacterales bacterium]